VTVGARACRGVLGGLGMLAFFAAAIDRFIY
jgi:hypothetical protein